MEKTATILTIEYPMAGKTYRENRFGVYQYSTFPRGSTLEGQERRACLDSFDTLEEAQRIYPSAQWAGGSCYQEIPVPRQAPPWFDPAAIGETWDDNDEDIPDWEGEGF